MKFEEHLRNNKENLQPKINKEAIWDKISKDLPSAKTKSNYKFLFIGAAFLVFIIILFIYNSSKQIEKHVESTNQELIALKTEINKLIKKEKTSSRIRAVSMSQDIESNDPEIISTLIDRMLNDSSPNVQLAAVRALERYLNTESVRIAMIETLGNTNDPYLQIKLIDMLSNQKEKRLLPYLDSIINNDDKRSIVLDRAEKGKRILKEL